MTHHLLSFTLCTSCRLHRGLVMILSLLNHFACKLDFLCTSYVHNLIFKWFLSTVHLWGVQRRWNQTVFCDSTGLCWGKEPEITCIPQMLCKCTFMVVALSCRRRSVPLCWSAPYSLQRHNSTHCIEFESNMNKIFHSWNNLYCKNNPVFSPCSFPRSMTRFHVSPSLLVCTFNLLFLFW